ncbi:MAG: hypothetical protein IT335_11205, partial [Thermomicrobiales bacterium]|nr:hypothetical protein [Thermomicrobiales bacterium]
MLVVMEEGADHALMEPVCSLARDTGLSPVIFDGEPPMVLLSGVPLQDIEDTVAALPGVVRVASSDGTASPVTNNLRIAGIRPLVSPAILMEELPLPAEGAILVQRSRREISKIVHGEDDRLLVVTGPCSIHDSDAALDYAARLAEVAPTFADDLVIVLRVYFEKPRTTVGWKG